MNDNTRLDNEEFGLHLMDAKDVDPVQMLIEDHTQVKSKFEAFEKENDTDVKFSIFTDTVLALTVHTKLEEELIYPLLKKAEEDLMTEAFEEHHVVDFVITELKALKKVDVTFEAKFKVLADLVKHHIEEEETQILPELNGLHDVDLTELAQKMVARKQQLKEQFSKLSSIEPVKSSAFKEHKKSPVKRKATRKAAARGSKSTGKQSSSAAATTKSSAAKKGVKKSSTKGSPKTKKSGSAAGGKKSAGTAAGRASGSTGGAKQTKRTTGSTKSGSTGGAKRSNRNSGKRKTGINSRNLKTTTVETDNVRVSGRTRTTNVYSQGEAGAEMRPSSNPQS